MGKKQKEELPDYTVANMDIDGMPWNSRRPWQILPGDPSKRRKEFDVKSARNPRAVRWSRS